MGRVGRGRRGGRGTAAAVAQVTVIPAPSNARGPAIHNHGSRIWIPGSTLTRRPGMTGLMRHVLQAGGVSGAADYARYPQFDLPGGGGDDATHRQRALADLAPTRQFAFGIRALALELLDRGERLLAHMHGVDRLRGLDHVVEHDFDFLGLALVGPF